MIKLKPISQQVVVIVGATSGIGLETARRFATKGAKLVLAGRSQQDLEITLNEARMMGADGIAVEADVSNYDQVKAIAERAIQTYGRIDTWAHVAAVSYYAKFEDTPPDEFRRVMEVNLNGPAYGVMAALPYIKREGRGAIIIVTSVDARVPVPLQSVYAASKHGVAGFIDSMRMELKHDGIPVSLTNILPASVNTPFFAKAKTHIGSRPNPLPPVYNPASVADAILFAAEHPIREISVGSAAVSFQNLRRLSPRLMESMLMKTGFQVQQSDVNKGPEDQNSLYQHIEGYRVAEGEFPARYSRSLWLQTHPTARYALYLLAALVPVGIYLVSRSRRPKGFRQKLVARAAGLAGIGALLTNRRRQSVPKRILRGAREILPDRILPRRPQTLPEKLVYSVKQLAPKGWGRRYRGSAADKIVSQARSRVENDERYEKVRSSLEKVPERLKEEIL